MEHNNLFDDLEKQIGNPFAEQTKKPEIKLPPVMPHENMMENAKGNMPLNTTKKKTAVNEPPVVTADKKSLKKEPVEDENAPIFEKEKNVDDKTSFKRVSYDLTKKILKREEVGKEELTDKIMEAYAYAQNKDKRSATVKGKTKNKRLSEYSSKTSKIALIKREESVQSEKIAVLRAESEKGSYGLADSSLRLIDVTRER